ncbi:MAG: S46 family peptidase [Bacteroidetes bacterium]|nr:S46 family peptidase [Bacteroidota bacterium]
MMKRIIIAFTVILIGLNSTVKADEGMWLPMLVERLNYTDMQKMGLQLTAEEIYSINNSSLKDAIIQFGGGCTGEMISSQGLILTNHHCGYGQIQAHSSVAHDYLTNGFWAMSKEEELKNPGLSVSFFIRMEDVAKVVLGEVKDDMTETQRAELIGIKINELTKEASEDGKYKVEIKSFFNGNEYYMFVYQTFLDVRLVGAPPSSIGKYGADTDNWMWPRHTGDFSLFRVYTAPDGSPAAYDRANIPMKPKHHLPVSIAGVEKNDFSMIFGYPGGTDRYMTSFGINLVLEQDYPLTVKIRRKKLDIIGEDMAASDKVRIQYASKYSRIANYWKNRIGMSKGLKKLKVADKKKKLEMDFASWVEQDPTRKEKYGTALKNIEEAFAIKREYGVQYMYFFEGIYLGPEVMRFSRNFTGLAEQLSVDITDQDKISKMVDRIGKGSERFFKDYNFATDKKLWAEMMKMYVENVPADQQPEYLKKMVKKYKGDYTKFAEAVYSKSIFVSEEKVKEFLKNPNAKAIQKDPVYVAMEAFFNNYYKYDDKSRSSQELLDKGMRLYVDGLRQMQADKKFYPDANFTLRLTYGKVLDYYPEDAVHFNYFTTLAGVMEKEDPDNWEFVVHPKLKKLFETKDYGQYGENGVMKVCFLTNHDITGGNSGSPVINAKGELIGLAFDGNWEAMSGDIAFEPELQRTINVDIRYVLFIIDKFAGAKNIIDELDLIKDEPKIVKVNQQKDDALQIVKENQQKDDVLQNVITEISEMVFPNPTKGVFYINLPANTKSVLIRDSGGSFVYHDFNLYTNPTKIEVNLGENTGTFNIEINIKDGKTIKKEVIKN